MGINKIVYNGNTLIDLTGDNVSATSLNLGYTAHDRTGAQITGTRPLTYDTRLWTNSSPSATFAGQSVSLSESAIRFTYLRIVWAWKNNQGVTDSNWTETTNALAYLYDMRNATSLLDGTNRMQMGAAVRPGTGYYARRCYFDSSACTSITFGATTRWGASGTDNSLLIPIVIEGCIVG